jgi:hypothetical protein
MNYSTLQEAYNVDTFEKKPRPSQKQNKNGNGVGNANTSPSFVESSKLALSSNKLQGGSCSPIQTPTYTIPISNECKKEHDEAMNVYTNANHNMNNMMNGIPNANDKQPEPFSQSQQPLATPQSSAMTSMFNLKNSSDNVMPYYDEDLEQYFNISNLNDEVKYNSNSSNSNSNTSLYMPNANKQSYVNNDTAEYTNHNTMIKHGNNLLNNTSYNLTPEEKKSAEEAIAYLKSIEEKITKNKNAVSDPVASNVNTGPGGFILPTPQQPPVPTPTPAPTETKDKSDKSDNYIYNAIFNISILLIIGIAIILLCDQMVELSIQIGMKRAVYILEPFIKTA